MTSTGFEMPSDQKASQMSSILVRMSPVSMGRVPLGTASGGRRPTRVTL